VYFETLKHKNKSIYFVSGELIKDLPAEARYTWRYYPELKDKQIDYANLYVRNDITDIITDDYINIKSKIKCHLKSIKEAKINTNNVFIYDLIPSSLLKEYCREKEKVTKYIIENCKKPDYYNILLSLVKIIEDIKKRQLGIVYDPFKSKTGRLTTRKGSFPILTMNKEKRKDIYPENDVFLSLDYNSFEARVLLALSEEEQPTIDIHDWNRFNIFNGEEREKAKKDYFAWLYNPDSRNERLEKVYKKTSVLYKYYKNNIVNTPYGINIYSDQFHALSYLIQSTASYLFYEQIAKIDGLLRNKKSFISFMIHDNVILDIDRSDKSAINKIVDVFSNTRYGKFLVNVKMGKCFGEMRDVCLK